MSSNVQHFTYRTGLTLFAAITELAGAIGFPGVFAYFVISGSTHVDIQVIGILALLFTFFLAIPGRDGIIWILKWKNEKIVLDGQRATFFNVLGGEVANFDLADVLSISFVRYRWVGNGAALMSQDGGRYTLRVGDKEIKIYDRLDGCDRFIALVKRFSGKSVFGKN